MSRNHQAYEGYINMYPPGMQDSHGISQSTPYPVDDVQEPINQVLLNKRNTDQKAKIGGSSSQVETIINPRYQQSFNFKGRNISQQSLQESLIKSSERNLSAESFQSFGSRKKDNTNFQVKLPDTTNYSEEALAFYKVYETIVKDGSLFTPEIQLKWCETLLEYAFKASFITQYNINAEKLSRKLTSEERLKNQRTILEYSLKILSKLISLNYPGALYLMGTLYSHQPYLNIHVKDILKQNDQKALDYYVKAADLNFPDACYRSGISFEYGRGVKNGMNHTDCLKQALHYYKRGVELCNEVNCMYKLGMHYLQGSYSSNKDILLEQDPIKALYWFEQATKSTDSKEISAQALYELGKIYEFDTLSPTLQEILNDNGVARDINKSIQYFHRCASECAYPLAQWKLGYCYEFGLLNFPIMAEKSIAWYAKSAMNKPRGNSMAMMALSGWYLTGAEGVLKPNDKEAFQWALRASKSSEGRLSRAEYALGFYYQRGIGTQIDMIKAKQHYEKAVELYHPKAAEALRSL